MDWVKLIVSSLIGGGGAGTILLTVFLYFRSRTDDKIKGLEEDVKNLREDKLKGIENKFECHLKEDKAQQILTELKHLNESVSEIKSQITIFDNKTDAIDRRITTCEANEERTHSFVQDVDKHHNQHMRDHHHG